MQILVVYLHMTKQLNDMKASIDAKLMAALQKQYDSGKLSGKDFRKILLQLLAD